MAKKGGGLPAWIYPLAPYTGPINRTDFLMNVSRPTRAPVTVGSSTHWTHIDRNPSAAPIPNVRGRRG